MMSQWDLIVLGGGSGGVACARRAAAHGARVALIEHDRLGGTCVIRGCVPKKLMMYASRLGAELREAGAWGWTVPEAHFDMAQWQSSKRAEIDRLEGIYTRLLGNSGVTVLRGSGRLIDAHTVQLASEAAGTQELQAQRIVVAVGGRPHTEGIEGLDLAMTSNEILDLEQLPARVGVIGAGFIALEFATILRQLGSRVEVFLRSALPLRGFDEDLRQRMAEALTLQGIVLHPQARIERVTAHSVQTEDGSVYAFDAVLNATGRIPNTAGLGLEAAGVALDVHGAIPVDAYSQTRVPSIFAIGDVTNRKNLTPVAIAEGRALADNEFAGQSRTVAHETAASAVFTQPPLATVGLTEDQARQRGAITVYEADFRPMKVAFAGGQQKTYMKLVVCAQTDRILGIHMLGDDAPEIIQSLAVAYTMGGTKADFDRTIAVHPTAAEEFVLMREPRKG